MEEIVLTKESKIFLVKALQRGRVDKEELRRVLGIENPVLSIEVVSAGLPFAYNEDEIDHV